MKPDDERQVRQKIARRVFPLEERVTALDGQLQQQAQDAQGLREQLAALQETSQEQASLIESLRADLDALRSEEP